MSWQNFGESVQESEIEVQGLAAPGIFSLYAENGGADLSSERVNGTWTVCDSANRFAWSELVMVDYG